MKKTKETRRAKILVAIINKEDEVKLTSTINRLCTAVHFSGIGHGTARSSYMNYFGFSDIEKRITFSIIPDFCEHSLLDAIGRELKLYLLGRGIAFTLPLSAISSIVEDAVLSSSEKIDAQETRSPVSKKEKTSMHELVIAVLEQKYTDVAIEAARAAGATGATVFHTKSINNARIEERMGTALPEQTDSIFFLTTQEYKMKIMEAIRDAAGLKTEGGAVIFSLPVDDLVGIGRFNGDINEEE